MATTIAKVCRRCQQEKPLTAFYKRPGYNDVVIPTEHRHVLSECKACMKIRDQQNNRLPPHETRTKSEMQLIEYLASRGIPALPGKALRSADVDVVAYGHVWIECKYSSLYYEQGHDRFKFGFSPKQRKHGVLGHVICLICEWGDKTTFHFFNWDDDVFVNEHGIPKIGLNYVPGKQKAVKHKKRNIMTQDKMDSAQDNVGLIHWHLTRIHNALCEGKRPVYGKVFRV